MWFKRLVLSLVTFTTATVSCMQHDGQTIMKTDEDTFIRSKGVLPNLADMLTLQTQSSIYYSYARDTEINKRFTQKNAGITLLVPTNRAVQALAKKPNDDVHADAQELSNEGYHERSRDRVRQWVGAHIIPNSPIDFTSTTPYDTLTSGITVQFKALDQDQAGSSPGDVHTEDGLPNENSDGPIWKKYVLNDGIKILNEIIAANGVIYIIDGTVKID